ncbi:MAG: glycosyltransferase family 4 protein [Kiritimatiellia bacterium]
MRIAYVLASFPSVSETFVLREIRALRKRRADIEIFSLRRPQSGNLPSGREEASNISYCPSILSLRLVVSQFYFLFSSPQRYFRAYFKTMSSARESGRGRGMGAKVFAAGAVFAFQARKKKIDHVHAHFMFVPADVAMTMSLLLGTGYSVSAHAWDIYTQSPEELAPHVRSARFISVCTEHGLHRLRTQFPDAPAGKIKCVRHGICLEEFNPPERPACTAVPLVLGVGRLVEKKGFIYLVEACRILKNEGFSLQCRILGGGPLKKALKGTIEKRDLKKEVSIEGEAPLEEVKKAYSEADVLVLPSVVDSKGDRDGMPNVIIEAMAMGVPVVTTAVSAAREILRHNVTGYMAAPADPHALAEGIKKLTLNPGLRDRIKRAGRETVTEKFDILKNVEQLSGLFEDSVNANH